MKDANVLMFDEPSSFLDISQRINAARLIRSLTEDDPSKYVIVVEHDLSILEFMSDLVCLLYGTPGAYGVITHPSRVREGINSFLAGFITSENLRFRPEAIEFKFKSENEPEEEIVKTCTYEYPDMAITLGTFRLSVRAGQFSDSEIIVLLGKNGTGKSTFIRLLAGKIKADNDTQMPELAVSYKPQEVQFKSVCTVRELLHKKIHTSFTDQRFISDVVKPMHIESLLDHTVDSLSGGELQRIAIILCLGKEADLYLIDEPSAMLDAEQRLIAAKVIKRFMRDFKKTAFIVEHDFIMATYMADQVIVYSGEPSINCQADSPTTMINGMNSFLKTLDVTFRRDPNNARPRVNKPNGSRDREQKKSGTYFHYDL